MTIVSLKCQYCGVDFEREKFRLWGGRGKYCSRECTNKSRIGTKQSEEWIRRAHKEPTIIYVTCQVCGKVFQDRPRGKEPPRKYCSLKCTGAAKKGVPLSKEHLERISKNAHRMIGPENPRWKGGITPGNVMFRTSEEMINWRRTVLERDGRQCGFCGITGVYVQADHIRPFSLYPELRLDPGNGQTLCEDCHKSKTRLDYIWYENYTIRL